MTLICWRLWSIYLKLKEEIRLISENHVVTENIQRIVLNLLFRGINVRFLYFFIIFFFRSYISIYVQSVRIMKETPLSKNA